MTMISYLFLFCFGLASVLFADDKIYIVEKKGDLISAVYGVKKVGQDYVKDGVSWEFARVTRFDKILTRSFYSEGKKTGVISAATKVDFINPLAEVVRLMPSADISDDDLFDKIVKIK